MAEDAIDKALAGGRLHAAGPCRTKELPLMGAQGYTPALFTDVAQHYRVPHRPGAIDTRVARYLAGALRCLLERYIALPPVCFLLADSTLNPFAAGRCIRRPRSSSGPSAPPREWNVADGWYCLATGISQDGIRHYLLLCA